MIESRSTDSPAQLFPALLNFPRQDSDCLFFNKQTGFTTLLERLLVNTTQHVPPPSTGEDQVAHLLPSISAKHA